MTIDALINKQDNFEVVRDQIAAILALETAAQVVLAAGEPDPSLWKLRVFTERSNPWEEYLNDTDTDRSPLVNVWVDNATFDPKASNAMERQKSETTFNIDCYAFAVAANVVAGGHKPGDREAAFARDRAVRLVRNILMADIYTYLLLRGVVWGRWPDSITFLQPEIDGLQAHQVAGARIAFRVSHNELSPQQTPGVLEYLSACVKRAENDEIVLTADYDYLVI